MQVATRWLWAAPTGTQGFLITIKDDIKMKEHQKKQRALEGAEGDDQNGGSYDQNMLYNYLEYSDNKF